MTLASRLAALEGYAATTQQEILGSVVGTTETAFDVAGADIDWPADIADGEEIEIEAVVENTGVGGATYWATRLYWGGKASGVLIHTVSGLGSGVGRSQRIRSVVKYDIAGASPSWQFAATTQDNVNPANTITGVGFAKTTQPTTQPIPIQVTGQFTTGSPGAGDKLKLRKLTVRKLAPQRVVT